MREDISAQLTRYKGYLEWDAFSAYRDGVAVDYPAITVELFIKETSLPIRRPKVTEITTIPTRDPMGDFETRTEALFFGTSEILQITLSGWMITPTVAIPTSWKEPEHVPNNWVYGWAPVSATNTSLNYLGNICYPEIVCAFIEGRMKQGKHGSLQRRDPDRYISPQGEQYDTPVIGSFDWNFTVTRKKQQFNMTLWLET